jgi:hypothetical protein
MEYPLRLKMLAIGLIVVGIIINFIISRRKFNRRAMTGAQGFRSYEGAMVTRFFEKIIRIVAVLMVITGILFLIRPYL